MTMILLYLFAGFVGFGTCKLAQYFYGQLKP